jgi:two-component sensor histidine kinase
MVCVPLTVFERMIGVMSCYTAERRQFTTEEVRALEALARQAAVSIEHARLQVRTTLMQEMHHRVKNNLQQVASLLRLQMNQSQDHHVDEALGDSLGRILAIASVHDLLSRDDLDHVGLRSLAENLIQHTSQSILRGSGIRFQVQGDDTSLSTSQATQVALILNELILNGVEHGFGMDQSGDIHVTVEVDETQVDVWVSNNGSQLPENFNEQELGLGLQIVNSLARALRGTFTMKNELGWTVAHLSFTRTSGE